MRAFSQSSVSAAFNTPSAVMEPGGVKVSFISTPTVIPPMPPLVPVPVRYGYDAASARIQAVAEFTELKRR
ncbi:MAG: hypothetical protein FJ398_19170 [Verrucomicrobia bacterium]|nr:hypothetical protein [Verrucomicrobiota bacterium]